MKKKMTSILLIVFLVLGTLPFSASAAGKRFEDVLEKAWYYNAVEYATENGLFYGTSETKFSPENSMDRGMFVTVLGRLSSVDTGKYQKSYFTDVKPSVYYSPYVQWAASYEIVSGTGNYKYSPGKSISRQEIATMMYRYAQATGNDTTLDTNALASFSDGGTVSSFAKDAMCWAVTHKILQGSNNKLTPKDPATRAQVAQIFYNCREFLSKHEITREPIELKEPPLIIYPNTPLTGNKIKDLLNQAPLMPTMTGTPADETVGGVLKRITNDKMTTYEKVKACYDYIIQHTRYGIPTSGWDEDFTNHITRNITAISIDKAYMADTLIRTGIGVCDDYAATFMVMTRMIGLDSYVAGGQIAGDPHAWNLIRIDGKLYLFDVQIEDRITEGNGGNIVYNRFCLEAQPAGMTYRYGYVISDSEGAFQTLSPSYYADYARYPFFKEFPYLNTKLTIETDVDTGVYYASCKQGTREVQVKTEKPLKISSSAQKAHITLEVLDGENINIEGEAISGDYFETTVEGRAVNKKFSWDWQIEPKWAALDSTYITVSVYDYGCGTCEFEIPITFEQPASEPVLSEIELRIDDFGDGEFFIKAHPVATLSNGATNYDWFSSLEYTFTVKDSSGRIMEIDKVSATGDYVDHIASGYDEDPWNVGQEALVLHKRSQGNQTYHITVTGEGQGQKVTSEVDIVLPRDAE